MSPLVHYEMPALVLTRFALCFAPASRWVVQVRRDMEKLRMTLDCSPPYLPDVSVYENAIARLQEENAALQVKDAAQSASH